MDTNSQLSDSNNKNSDIVARKLPKPVFVAGAAFEDEVEELNKKTLQEEKEEEARKEKEKLEDQNTLPMPVVFGEDEELDTETVEQEMEPKPDIDNSSAEAAKPAVDEQEDNAIPLKPEVETTAPLSTSDTLHQESDDNVQNTHPAEPKDEGGLPQPLISTPPVFQSEMPPVVSTDSSQSTPEFSSTHTANETAHSEYQAPTILNPLPNQEEATTQEEVSTQRDVPDEINTLVHQEPLQDRPYIPPTFNAPNTPGFNNVNQSNAQQSVQFESQINAPKGNGIVARAALGVLAVFIGASTVVGGYMAADKFFGNDNKSQKLQAVAEPQPTPQVQVTPTPTETPLPSPTTDPKAAAIDKAKVKVKVLNGSGTKGAAGKVKTLLEDAGFKNVKTGNADSFTYEESVINYKAKFESLVPTIQEDLASSYKATKGETLKTSDEFDVYVIVGSSKSGSTSKSTSASSTSDTTSGE